jgi:hypothetical protein
MLLVELLPKAPEAVVEALPNGPLVRGYGGSLQSGLLFGRSRPWDSALLLPFCLVVG